MRSFCPHDRIESNESLSDVVNALFWCAARTPTVTEIF
jgi:hypothetical protein